MQCLAPIPEFDAVDRQFFQTRIRTAARPAVLRGLVSAWPIVASARRSTDNLVKLLRELDSGLKAQVVEAKPEVEGRIFYADDFSGFNFDRRPATLSEAVELLLALADAPSAPAIFLESLPASRFAPAFPSSHPMPLLDSAVEARLWVGNAVKVNTHFDLSYNIACVAAGRRRFTLFPPGQIDNLYVAPFDFTPSGAPVSLAQLSKPDFARFPRLTHALEHALVAELAPGDAIYIPYGWWHHVESLTPFNVLVNYWWDEAKTSFAPHGALLHSLLAIRDLPADQREVWSRLFAELVFTDPREALAHLPPQLRGMFGPPSSQRTNSIRQKLLQDLQRTEP